jgi:acetylcholinesterase
LTAYGGRDEGLFVGAVAQSSFWPTSPAVAEVEYQYQRVLNGTGCGTAAEPLSCLRSLNVSSLLEVNTASPFPGATGNPLWYFLPVKDGDLIRDDKWKMFDQGRFIKVPLLIANDNNEGSSFAVNAATSADVTTFFKNNYPKLNDTQLQEVIARYPLMAPLPKHSAWFPSASAAYGDATFICPGESLSRSMARHFSPQQVWAYRCTIVSASNVAAGLGTSHTFEMAAIMGTHFVSSVASTWLNENAAAIPVTMHYYISFIRSLNPNTYRFVEAPFWEPWGSRMGRRLLLQTNATAMEVVPLNSTRACDMWDSLSEVMEV